MELFIAFMYMVGIAIMIWFMAHIKKLADMLFPLPPKEESRPRCNAERLSEEINREYCNTKGGEGQ